MHRKWLILHIALKNIHLYDIFRGEGNIVLEWVLNLGKEKYTEQYDIYRECYYLRVINNVLRKDKIIMRKTNLVKTILCGLIGTIAMGTAVFAGTINRESYVRGKNNYSNSYKGTLGNYAAGGEADTAATSAQNTSGSSRWFSVQVYEYNVVTNRDEGRDVLSKEVSNGSSINVEIDRDKNSKAYNYIHVGQGYASNVYSSATMLDNYTYTAKQYYE